MNAPARSIRVFLASEDGPTAVQYAVMLGLVLVVCVGLITWLGWSVYVFFTSVDYEGGPTLH